MFSSNRIFLCVKHLSTEDYVYSVIFLSRIFIFAQLLAISLTLTPEIHQLSVGLELIPVKDSIIFSQFWPLSYNVPLPDFPVHSWEISCNPLNSSKMCAPFLSISKALTNFSLELQNLHFFNNEHKNTFRNQRSLFPFLGTALHWLTGTATDDELQTFRLNYKQISDHVKILESHEQGIANTLANFSAAINQLADQSSLAFSDINKAMQHIIANENEVFSNILSNTNTLQSFIMLLLQIDTHAVNNLQQLLFHYKFHNAFQQCNNNKLPRTLIAPETLLSDLMNLRSKLRAKNLDISPTFSIDNAYELHTTACVYSDSDILIHVKIPIIPVNYDTALFKTLSFPIASQNETCTIQVNYSYIIMTNNEIFPLGDTDLQNCRVTERPFFCKIPTINPQNALLSHCIFTLRNATVIGQLQDVCKFSCVPTHPFSIHHISGNNFALINPPTSLKILSPNHTVSNLLFPFRNAYLTLPCGYSLLHHNTVILQTPFLCLTSNDNPRIIHLHHPLTITNPLFPIPPHKQISINRSFNGLPIKFFPNISKPILASVPNFSTTPWYDIIDGHDFTVYTSVISFQSLITLLNLFGLVYVYRRLNSQTRNNVAIPTELQPLQN